ncbi:hypothetical protein EIN_030910 [Entamoeba invadens IP1]|uniref:VHS domain-containing protein n=2 Tax=Entamoeba invadens TaxID=33085 RepID=A0A0A1TY42_ENTIV|nr:hypothetical protein EIN_030910 [Entamoeba invadens IP1]ELP86410.1 hypothetical protein EIN_030910 [Entamoeba invadens IP1]BAN42187.1 hypothetical protein [Entamoeba invadens]|eukprot:XP_004185756.1 hypothetical protein EIN_030910 [Entamoeba invadens IP1]
MSKAKQTVPLSQLVDHATNQIHPQPSVKSFATLSKIASTIPNAQIALRVQLISKMKAYCNGFLPKKEMYYCLCLMDYLVENCPEFRKQVLHEDFIALFERSADFDKSKKSKKPGMVTEKSLQILQSWGNNYTNELFNYEVMYNKYVEKGIVFPPPIVRKDTHLEQQESTLQQINDIVAEIEECSELIQDTLEKEENTVNEQSAKSMHKRAVELNSRFNVLFVKFIDTAQESSDVQKYSEIESNFTNLIVQLASIINNPKKEIYRTFTTGHILEDNTPKQDNGSNAPIIERLISQENLNTQQQQRPTGVRGAIHLAPPPSKGQPLRISRKNTDISDGQITQQSKLSTNAFVFETNQFPKKEEGAAKRTIHDDTEVINQLKSIL